MSDSASLGSTSSLGLEAEPTSNGCRHPRSLHTRKSLSSSSRDSSQDARSRSDQSEFAASGSADDTPSKESIGTALDKYVAASKEGREAFHNGNLRDAVREFNEALDIELQTELECLYDTSIGMVSGLVRKEVESRLDMQGKYLSGAANERCSKILEQLGEIYETAADGMKGKKSSSPQWYLQMGAALVVINEWEKAKAIYTEGMNACKDKKRLKTALKDLIKIEQMTSYGEIPAEDQPDYNLHPPSPRSSPSHSPSHSPHMQQRIRAGSIETSALRQVKQEHTRGRATSLSLDRLPEMRNGHSRSNTSPSPVRSLGKGSSSPSIMKREKRLSFNFFNFRRSSAGLLLSSKSPCVTSPEEVEQWKECFEPSTCRVLGQSGLQPSAITHMRRLSSVGGEGEDMETDLDQIKLNCTYTAVNHGKSMVIEDDDSELDDSDD